MRRTSRVLGGAVACAAGVVGTGSVAEAAERNRGGREDGGLAPFTEEAAARGLDYVPNQPQQFGYGVGFADLDADGDPDVVAIGAAGGVIGVFENDGTGHFTDRTGVLPALLNPSAVAAADYDRDGDLDLYVTRWGRHNVLLRNDGDWTFTDVTAEAGVAAMDTEDGGATWGDFDGDGWLDLYVSNHEGRNTLYRNLGDGTFEDVTEVHGVGAADQLTFQSTFMDYDRDGDPDLYLTNTYGQHCASLHYRNLLFENVGGTFVDVTDAANAMACVDAMCITLGDVDGNGFEDVYVTDNNVPGNVLLLNQGDGTYVEDAAGWGVESFATAWGSVFLDFDNDARLDLYVGNQNLRIPNRLYRNPGTPPMVEMGEAMGVGGEGATFGVAAADVDGDGDVDLLVFDSQQPLRLYVNQEGARRSWAAFDVRGPGGDHWATNVHLTATTGRTAQVRELVNGTGYKSQHQMTAFFGLADATVVDELVVQWAWGPVRTLVGYPAGQRWTVHHPDRLGDADGDGQWTLADFAVLLEALEAGTVQPGLEVMDLDGDAAFDSADVSLFLARYSEPLEDCDGDGTPDLEEIALGAPDADGDGVPDDCDGGPGDPGVVGDLDGDGAVTAADLGILMQELWGTSDPDGDLDGSGTVGFGDLLVLLANWG